jgi:dihydropteroate synthase
MQLGRYLLDLSIPRIMGVLNATPDSFSDGGAVHARDGHLDISRVLRRVEAMVEEGADIIDVGGESTRPGAAAVTVAEELQRVVPVVEVITARFDVPVSVDTSTPEVMTAAAEAGGQPDQRCAGAATSRGITGSR